MPPCAPTKLEPLFKPIEFEVDVDARRARLIVPGILTIAPTAIFAAGYVLVWTAFSVLATTAQSTLQQAALLSPTMQSTSGVLGGLLLMAAGVYQLTPLKEACLRHCRSPIQFFTRHWRPGRGGALRLGVFHGAYCVGCCWALMGLLFVGGVMNLLWVVGLAIFILAEKTAFLETRLARAVSGAGLVAAGIVAVAVAWHRCSRASRPELRSTSARKRLAAAGSCPTRSSGCMRIGRVSARPPGSAPSMTLESPVRRVTERHRAVAIHFAPSGSDFHVAPTGHVRTYIIQVRDFIAR